MSTELQTIPTMRGDLTLNSFFGGQKIGPALQLTQGCGMAPDQPGYIQLSRADVMSLLPLMDEWAAGEVYSALRAVLLFYHVGQWTEKNRAEWLSLTGSDQASTKVLCDTVRRALGESR